MRKILAVYVSRANTDLVLQGDFFTSVTGYAEELTAPVDLAVWGNVSGPKVDEIKDVCGVADQLFVPPKTDFKENNELAAAWVFEVARKTNASIIMMPHNQSNVEIAARLAFRLKAGLVTDCVSLKIEQGDLNGLVRPLYGSKVIATYSACDPLVVTIRDKRQEVKGVQERSRSFVFQEVTVPNIKERVRLLGRQVMSGDGEVNLLGAKLVIGAGRGVGSPEGLQFVKDQAHKIGAALGVSKAVVDAGWAPVTSQIGISGKKINPHIYIAVGISGSIQHMTGVAGARVVIAINTDKEAPIMENTDLGLVGDYKEILPSLISMIATRQ
ncbi:electron transfer flavoprotein subunit alpha/FixB family protein [Paradesulfitobacterium ferrireducens]|uniref:electron transfer flavoprotein subunit alpha/FixB family protein n=1 Tax=Paradesulfitobacterium ferrireducens TaxID=2816476 RepID=UPI001A8EDAB4|nr:electron transfer flavoprotein subunit alpha/FixB family protein [Paradesulfitobacterium ferrireducens]